MSAIDARALRPFGSVVSGSLTHGLVFLEQFVDLDRVVFEVHFDVDAVEQQIRVSLPLHRHAAHGGLGVDVGWNICHVLNCNY